jgi:beta-lactamase regulating signal transducer with metallopeptidase domain
MSIASLLESPALTSLLVTLAAQSILISILGMLAMKWLGRKSAPVRGLVCAGAIAALCLVFVVSIGFQMSGVSWHKSDLNEIWEKAPAQNNRPMPEPQTAVTPRVQTPSSPAVVVLDNSKRMRMYRSAGLFINAFGFIWAGGFLFLLLKLGYGLVFLQGFRFGLARVEDGKFDGLVQAVAGAFRKKRLPELYTSPKMESPITIGLLNPIVILPEKLQSTLSETELKSILLHELAHIYHFDHVVGVIKRIVLAAHWWNPLAYRINAEHDMAREEVSDNYVLSELNPKEYSQCLAALAEKVSLISSFPAAAGMAGRRFSLVKRVETILSQKRSLAMRTSLNLKLMTFAVCAILTLFIAGLHGQVNTETTGIAAVIPQSPKTATPSITVLQMEGRKLSPEQVAILEKVEAENPDDLKIQTLLLSYYFSNKYKDSKLDEAIANKAEQTVLRLIRNHPEAEALGSPEGQIDPFRTNYAEGERLWKAHLLQRPNELKILWNAGNFFIQTDIDLTINCYKKGRNLDLENAASWDRQLGLFYKLKMRRSSADESPSLADEALSSLESAHAETNVQQRSYLLPDLAKAALATDQLEKAAEYADQMLATTESMFKGDLVYNGNFVLGMIAVKKGDIEAAEKYLLAAGDTTGSPVLNSFGPNMSLAKELLDRGRRDTVLTFLKKCYLFWNKSTSPCGKWIQELEEGKKPDFRRNLNY